MNLSIQIGIGLLPGTIVAMLLLFKRRAFKVNKILFAWILAVVSGSFLYSGGFETINAHKGYQQLSQKKMIPLANAFVQEGAGGSIH